MRIPENQKRRLPVGGLLPRSVGALMLSVAFVGVLLGTAREFRSWPASDWRQRALALHAAIIAVIVPLATALGYFWLVAPVADRERREMLTTLTFVCGFLGWVAAFSSLLFWLIFMATTAT